MSSAALALYTGAVNSKLVPVGGKDGGLPESMLAVGGLLAFENNQKELPKRVKVEDLSEQILREIPRDLPVGGIGNVVHNRDVKINWKGGIKGQGIPAEDFIESERPSARRLEENATTFDLHDETPGDAISGKTINTLSYGYIKNPRGVYGKIKMYVDEIVNYDPLKSIDIDPDEIEMKSLHIFIPYFTSPSQWNQIYRGIIYGKSKRVDVIITRVIE